MVKTVFASTAGETLNLDCKFSSVTRRVQDEEGSLVTCPSLEE